MLWFFIGVVAGVVLCAFVANRKPEWFAQVTKIVG